jgi:hypothetical protein
VKYTDDNVTFDLQNRATNGTASLGCQRKVSDWNSCSIQGSSSNLTLGASVLVGESSASFLVKETWTCSDRGKAYVQRRLSSTTNRAPRAEVTTRG